MDVNILEFIDIHRAYRGREDVLKGVSFALAPGEVVGLLGRNGAGKTTLIRIAMGMLDAQEGRVRVFGMDPRRDAVEVKQRVGYVSEDQILPDFLRVEEVIRLHRDLFPGWDRNLEVELRERFGMDPRAKIGSLSKGQARQVALLCAVSHRPDLLLLDEPAGGLDPSARREFLETSIQMLNESGTTILFSSHYMTDVERLAARIVMLHDGRVLLDRELDALREEFTLALVPRTSGAARADLLALEGCVGVRERGEALHAVFRMDPDAAAAAVREGLGVNGVRCTTLALEEMFIELTGGQD
jgi:ABC-2 type transport system ATP-binding protein